MMACGPTGKALARAPHQRLEAEVEAFIASEPAKFNAEIIEDNGVRTIRRTSEISGAPEEISAIVGDVIHNLRTALDLTACDMVRAAGQSDKDVYFPFSNSAQELNEMNSPPPLRPSWCRRGCTAAKHPALSKRKRRFACNS